MTQHVLVCLRWRVEFFVLRDDNGPVVFRVRSVRSERLLDRLD